MAADKLPCNEVLPSSLPRPGKHSRRERALKVSCLPDVNVVEIFGERPGPTIAFVAGVHGDEVECIGVLEDWLETAQIETGVVIVIAIANPAALAVGTRRGPDDVDLNRVAPGNPASEKPSVRLAAALHEALRFADAVVTLHSIGRSGETIPYVEFPDGRSSAPEVTASAQRLALKLGLPWAESWDWPRGLLPAALVRDGVPAVEVEIGGLGRTTHEGNAIGLSAINHALSHFGMAGEPEESQTPTLAVRHTFIAPSEGRVRQRALLGQRVAAGEVVAEIRDAKSSSCTVLTAPADGTMAIHCTHGQVLAGEEVAVLFIPAAPE